ncbi:class I SAM-dependent methyltransferase [Azospirillum sp.]|uniref:class I SAM-dependent methyltransferase n=1 Tax=Azospirillum sp. TaxID=34012 RepID=UPI002D2ADA0A|nr:class I SAM-dependent methyltransferase [Azospirillum sp.]HYD69450.1 class I SAM-dependent methyltransferase [Azospirillum sp.]
MPVHQNLVVATPEQARRLTRGALDMVACEDCGFVFNRAFDSGRLAYGEDYDNTQSCSPYFDAYLDDLARHLVEAKGVRHAHVVEVGCGKGHFLRKLVSYPGAENRGTGFDPSYVGPDRDGEGKLVFERRFYGADCADVPADVVVCRHVIEHVPEPLSLLQAVRAALIGSPRARVFFETPCVEWILKNRILWDFFYEHCSLFTAASLSLAFARAGFHVEGVRHIFGGQYLWLEATPAEGAPAADPVDAGRVAALARAYGCSEGVRREEWALRLRDLRRQGAVALWGAGAKGATLANLVDPDGELIDCIVDVNPNKQGRHLPGTGHPIVSPAALAVRGVRNAVLMNPNYRDENLRLLSEVGIACNLIDWT